MRGHGAVDRKDLTAETPSARRSQRNDRSVVAAGEAHGVVGVVFAVLASGAILIAVVIPKQDGAEAAEGVDVDRLGKCARVVLREAAELPLTACRAQQR